MNDRDNHISLYTRYKTLKFMNDDKVKSEDNVSVTTEDSDTFSDDSFEPDWIEEVDKMGELFYVETTADEEIKKTLNIPIELKNGDLRSDSIFQNPTIKNEQKNTSKTFNPTDSHYKLNSNFGDSFTVYIIVNPGKFNYGRRMTKCESLLGIIPGHFSKKILNSLSDGHGLDEQKVKSWIMIQGFIPDGEAAKSGQLKIGDWLQSINDLAVSFVNINSMLSSIERPARLKLTLIRPHFVGIKLKPPTEGQKNLIKCVSDGIQPSSPDVKEKELYHILYLTKDISSQNSQDRDDILYQFPNTQSKLADIRGMFLTLSHMMCDVTQSEPISSTLLLERQLIHVGYFAEERELLIVCLPAARLLLNQLHNIIDKIVLVLRLLYKSLSKAFRPLENKSKLDEFFALIFHQFKSDSFTTLQMSSPASFWLVLPDDIKIKIDAIMSEYESSEFADMSEDFLNLRRAYSILGTCLFCKGLLVATHLPYEDLADIIQYLDLHGVLKLTYKKPVHQLVIWREVFPTRRRTTTHTPSVGYIEPVGRWFLLVVGMKHMVLSVLLEAGGCASSVEGHPGPDPFYVEQAQATLLQMESVGIPTECETRINGIHTPALSSLDWFASTSRTSKDDKMLGLPKFPSSVSKHPEVLSVRKKPSPQPERHLLSPGSVSYIHEAESDNESSQSAGTSEGSSLGQRDEKSQGSDESVGSGNATNIFRSVKQKRNLPSAYNMAAIKQSLQEKDENLVEPIPKLVSGCENTLFHYLHMDRGEGIFICPTDETLNLLKGTLHQQLLTNFNASCLAIHQIFENSLKCKDHLKTESQHKFGVNKALSVVKEHGILFQCFPDSITEKKSQKSIHYWVVGRLITEPEIQEFFICFHDSVSQNVIELAFRLCFGNTI